MSTSRGNLVSALAADALKTPRTLVAAAFVAALALAALVLPAAAQDGSLAANPKPESPQQLAEYFAARIDVLEAEQVEFRGLAEGALESASRGDLPLSTATEIYLAASAKADAGEAEIHRLNSVVSAGEPFGLDAAIFPVGEVTEFIDSWGFARSGGRRHKGTDILAPRGADLLAIESGTVQRKGNSAIGGLSFYLLGDSGSRYYYTHLDSLADQEVGERVIVGEVIGYVGDSGNARGTPHLHFQWAPDGKSGWINPYPLLAALWEAEYGSPPPAR